MSERVDFKLAKPPSAFVGNDEKGAFVLAAEWLAEQCAGDFEPLNLRAFGTVNRVTFSREHDELVILRRRTPAKAKTK